MRPVVTVPVLSSTIVSTRRVDSRTSGPLISRPSWAPRPVPTSSAVGVASPSAHGQAMISTATAAVNANSADSPAPSQKPSVATASPITIGTKIARDAVGEALDRRLAGLGLGDEPRDLRERGVAADLGGAHDEAAAGVDGRAGDRVAGLLLDRHRLAGEQRLVDRARALARRRRRWRPSRPGGRRSGRRPRAARPGRALAPSARLDVLGAELEQRRQRGAGAALGARLEVAAGEQERRHDRADLEVDLVRAAARVGDQVERHAHVRHAGVAEEQRVERPAPGGEHADRDQRVHRRGAVAEVRPRGAVERPRAPQDHRRGELQAAATASCRTAARGSSRSAAPAATAPRR